MEEDTPMEENPPIESNLSLFNGELTGEQIGLNCETLHTQYPTWASSTEATLDTESLNFDPQDMTLTLESLSEGARAIFHELTAMADKKIEVEVRTDTSIVNAEATISTYRPLPSAEDVTAQIQRMGYTDVMGVKRAVQQADGDKDFALSLLKDDLEARPGMSSTWEGHPFMTCYCLGEGFDIPWTPEGCSSCLKTSQGSSAGYVVPSNDGLPDVGGAVEDAISHRENAGSSPLNTYAAFATSSTNTASPPVPTAVPPPPQPPRHRNYASPLQAEVRTALFDIVRNLAPTHGVRHWWNKVSEAMTGQGYKKSGDAWRIEWCRYGSYENRFDERRAVFVDGMRERLELARCLDPKGREWIKDLGKEMESAEKGMESAEKGKGKGKEM
jgi:hypothetical protein